MKQRLTLTEKFRAAISTHNLLLPNTPTLVALSGGADSVALLLLCLQEGFPIVVAHCNFHLRGKESDRDEAFVTQLCQSHGVALHIRHFDTAAVAQTEGISIEMAARRLRYDFFEELRSHIGAQAIAVAHHRDDNNETLLLNLIRGTGLRGLTGMKWKNGYVVRPLLDASRQDILNYLKTGGHTYVDDSTNAETLYKRNKIRHQLLPLLRELNPSVDEALAAAIHHLAEAEVLYAERLESCFTEGLLRRHEEGIEIVLNKLKQHSAAHTLLYEALKDFGFNSSTTADIYDHLDAQSGTLFESPEAVAVIHQGKLLVERRPQPFAEQALPESGEAILPDGGRLLLTRCPICELSEIPRTADTACLDADSFRGALRCRRVVEGDRFRPFGMKGSKLVSDFLTDRKRSRLEKMKAMAVCDEAGIVWLVNERPAADHAVTSDTRNILLIRYVR
ncbi:MAG: tRNA lysidine(34) synthetase TilS [Bacteroidaceae bacterium]|nr:tRNA lysidine(34) synthetase TilS [Bacteroidaceae bacterium]